MGADFAAGDLGWADSMEIIRITTTMTIMTMAAATSFGGACTQDIMGGGGGLSMSAADRAALDGARQMKLRTGLNLDD
jgi:hypothetical protein